MGLFSKTKDNYEKRRMAAEYHYDAMKYINEGKEIYNRAYSKLREKAGIVRYKVSEYESFKKGTLEEVKRLFSEINMKENIMNVENTKITLKYPEPSDIVPSTFVTGENPFTELKAIFQTVPVPSISDLISDSSDAYYTAKMEKNDAKLYKEQMKMERELLNNARIRMGAIEDYIQVEKDEIKALIEQLRKVISEIKMRGTESVISKEEVEALEKISILIADTLTTQFINNDYSITNQYETVHNQIKEINHSLAAEPDIHVSGVWTRNVLKILS